MAKTAAVRRNAQGTRDAQRESAFQRRKQYAEQLRRHNSVAKSAQKAASQKKLRVIATQIAGRSALRDATNVAKYKARVTKEEMEELGCLPVGILSTGSLAREAKRTLSFSPRTIAFENTPLRGTPVKHKSLVEMAQSDRAKEVKETLVNLEQQFEKRQTTANEILMDLKGLELGRKDTVWDLEPFWSLKMRLLLEVGDKREAVQAGVHALFSAENKSTKSQLHDQLHSLLSAEVEQGKEDEVEEAAPEVQEETILQVDTTKKPEETMAPKEPPAAINRISSPSLKPRTPPAVVTTPVIRTGSAAKSLRFTPLLASVQRRASGSTLSAVKKPPRTSFKLTPLRRSKRLAKTMNASDFQMTLSSSYRAENITH